MALVRPRVIAMRFDVNGFVKVRLTKKGHAIHHATHDLVMGPLKYEHRFVPLVEDMEGWSEWQLWELMRVFGQYLYQGCEMPFETFILIPDEPNSAEPSGHTLNSPEPSPDVPVRQRSGHEAN